MRQPHRAGPHAPALGRANELALVTQAFARAVSEPSVQLVTLTGEPGVGKTRLLWEFRRYLDDRPDLVYWRQGRCLPYGEGVTYWALGEMVKAQAGVLETDPPGAVLGKLETALAAVSEDESEREWLRGRLAPLVGVGGVEGERGGREEAFTAWVRFLESIAARDPLVLVFEDLHWADGPLVDFVEHLVEWSSGVPLFVVCSARPELYERHPGWGGGKRNSTTLSLSPLSEADTARLLSALLEQAVLPAEVQSELLERAGGNPLYAEEFVRMLLDRGILERHDTALRLSAGADGVPLPETVQALIAARLDTLAPDRKALLHDASVVGKVFWSGAVASIGGVDEAAVRQGLHDLARKELVRTVRISSVHEQTEYSFWHALVRDVAYGQIPRTDRAAKHLATADWIERMVGERVSDQSEFLAYHYERAIDLTTAAGGRASDELRRKAAQALRMAGERAERLDVAKAVAFYRRAEAALPAGDPDRPVLHVRTLAAAADVGEVTETEMAAAYEEAVAELRARGDLLGAGNTMADYSRWLKSVGHTDRSDRLAIEAVEMLEPRGPSRELAAAYTNLAGNSMMGGRLREWKRWTESALELANRLGLPEFQMRALQYRGIHREMEGDRGGLADLEESLRMGMEMGLGRETAVAYTNLGDWVASVRGASEGLRYYEEGIRFSERRGLGGIQAWARAETTWRLFDLGRWDEVTSAALEVRRWFGERGRGQPIVISGVQDARVRALRGELDRASELMEELLPEAREIRDTQTYRPALGVAALIAVRQGRSEEAGGLLDELIGDLQRETRGRVYGMREGTLPARLLVDAERASRIAEVDPSSLPGYPLGEAILIACTAEVREARGDLVEALAMFERAEAMWAALGHVFDRALALLGQARCLAALGRVGEADQPAGEAQGVFESLRTGFLAAEGARLAPGASSLTS